MKAEDLLKKIGSLTLATAALAAVAQGSSKPATPVASDAPRITEATMVASVDQLVLVPSSDANVDLVSHGSHSSHSSHSSHASHGSHHSHHSGSV